jgi:hypothetical protein
MSDGQRPVTRFCVGSVFDALDELFNVSCSVTRLAMSLPRPGVIATSVTAEMRRLRCPGVGLDRSWC